MAKFLTEEDILKAKSYIPISDKAVCARVYADKCIDKVEITIGDGEQKDTLPPLYQENPLLKSLYGMLFLLERYFGKIEADEKGEIIFTREDYDEWGEGSVFNALERMKASKNIEVRNKAFDIVADYREFYRMLGTEIASILAAKNDLLSRLSIYFTAQITPDAFKELLSSISQAQQEIAEYEAKPKEWLSEKPTSVD